MEPQCDYCGMLRPLIYCKSDLAKLCLNCDYRIHSANLLSRKHPRSLICNKCVSQPAVIRCLDEKVLLCQSCHWTGINCSSLGHRLQILSPYSGCPSVAEFARMWSSVLEPSGSSSGFGYRWISPFVGSFSLNYSLDQRDNNNDTFELTKLNDLEGWIDSSSSQNISYAENLTNHSFFSKESNLAKECSDLDLKLQDSDDICEGLNMDDVPLNFDAGEDILGCSENHTKYNQIGDTESDCLLVDKNTSVTESNCLIENTLKPSSSGQQDYISYQSSQTGGSANNVMQPANWSGNNVIMSSTCNRNISIGLPPPQPPLPAVQVHPSISVSLSNITGESSATDYQDCGLSPAFVMGDSSWESNLESSNPQARDRAKLRYNQKKSKRLFGKQIRYASRKARADTRKRVKGRFVKAGEAYDYDPSVSRNF